MRAARSRLAFRNHPKRQQVLPSEVVSPLTASSRIRRRKNWEPETMLWFREIREMNETFLRLPIAPEVDSCTKTAHNGSMHIYITRGIGCGDK